MSVLTNFLQSEATHVRDESARLKAATEDWQRAAQNLVHQMVEWLKLADPEGLLRVRQVDHTFEVYDLGKYVIKGLAVTFGRSTLRINPGQLEAVGVVQLPGEPTRRRVDGRFEFDNGTDRRSLYLVRDGDRDVWVWWAPGGVGQPFDRDSFEATVVSFLR